MKTAAELSWGYQHVDQGHLSGLGKALQGCVVWLQLDGGPSAGGRGDVQGKASRRVCPYEGACTEKGRCFLPRRPRC